MTQPFDPVNLRTTGEALALAQPVGLAEGWHSRFSVSANGVLVHSAGNRPYQEVAWFDRRGGRIGTIGSSSLHFSILPSPDERRVAVRQNSEWPNPEIDVWLTSLSDGSSSRFTFNRIPPAGAPVWSPAGDRIIFSSNRPGQNEIYEKAITSPQEEKLLLKGAGIIESTDWSRDGHFLMYQQYDPKTRWDLWLLRLGGVRTPPPFLQTDSDEQRATFSPDGRWFSYQSNESGKDEIYVKPFSPASPGAGGRWQISSSGGIEPRWRRDGKELFYIAPDRKLMSVAVKTGDNFEAGTPQALFPTQLSTVGEAANSRYAPIGDGHRFLMIIDHQPQSSTPATVVLNWQAALRANR